MPDRFTASVTLKGVCVVGGRNGHYPTKMKLYARRIPRFTFASSGLAPT